MLAVRAACWGSDMAGLLDYFRTPEGQGLLSAGFGGLAGARRGQPLNSIGRAGLAGLSGYANAQDREMQLAENAKQNEIRGLQVDLYKQNLSAAQRKAAEEQRIKDLVASQFSPVTGTSANAATGISGPRPEAATAIGRTPAPNFQMLAAQGVPFDVLKGLADSQNLGRSEVARTVKGMGADGKEYEYQVDKFGQRVGDGLPQYRAPVQADTGSLLQFLDAYTLQPVTTFNKTMSPDAKASNAVAWANNSIARERLNLDKNGYSFSAELGGYVPKAPGGKFVPLNGAQGGKLSPGYRWSEDGTKMVAIPGGPADKAATATEGERKAATLLMRMDGSLKQLNQAVKENPGSETPEFIAEAVRKAPFGGGDTSANLFTSGGRQQVEAAQLDMLDAALTLGTGAAYTREQLEGYRRSYFPQLYDDPKTVAAKKVRLDNVLNAARIAAGRAAPSASPGGTQAPGSDSGFTIVEVRP